MFLNYNSASKGWRKKFKYLLFCTIFSIFAAFCEMARSTFRLSLLHQWKSQLQTYTKQKQSLCKHPSISRQKMEKMCNKFFLCSYDVLETKVGKLISAFETSLNCTFFYRFQTTMWSNSNAIIILQFNGYFFSKILLNCIILFTVFL